MTQAPVYRLAPSGAPDMASGLPPMSFDPQLMLAQQSVGKKRFRPSILTMILGVLLVAEVGMPGDAKPSKMAGGAAANFYGEIMDEDNRKRLDYAEQEAVAYTRADRENESVAWQGRCSALAVFDNQLGAMCMQAANAFYNQTLPPSRRYRETYRGGS